MSFLCRARAGSRCSMDKPWFSWQQNHTGVCWFSQQAVCFSVSVSLRCLNIYLAFGLLIENGEAVCFKYLTGSLQLVSSPFLKWLSKNCTVMAEQEVMPLVRLSQNSGRTTLLKICWRQGYPTAGFSKSFWGLTFLNPWRISSSFKQLSFHSILETLMSPSRKGSCLLPVGNGGTSGS